MAAWWQLLLFDLLKVWIWWGFLGCCLGGDTQKNGSLVVEMKKPGCFFGVFGEDVSPLKRWWIFQPALLVYQRV